MSKWTNLVTALIFIITRTSSIQPIGEERNTRPIIAVLAQKYPKKSNQSYISANYVKFIESAGARVVPIPHYFNRKKIEELFQYVNGVLFPGGAIKWFVADYYKHAKLFWELALKANDEGTYFPIWGTCLGFQAMQVIRINRKVTSRTKAKNMANSLKFTTDANYSRLFGDVPCDLYQSLNTENVTYNNHKYGILTETFNANPQLQAFFRVLTVNNDVNGQEYVSTVEAYHYPIYGVQWHPEKSNFGFLRYYKNTPHNAVAIKVSLYMANFFVNEARKNFHRFPTKKMEDEHLIYRFPALYSAEKFKGVLGHSEQVYLFC